MSEAGAAPKRTPFLISLFNYNGRIGPVRYWAAIGCAIVVFVVMFIVFASAMDPRGSGDPAILVLLLIVAFIWMLAAATVQRLRDAGRHPALALMFLLLPVMVFFIALENVEVALFVGFILFIGMLAFIGHIETFLKLPVVPE
jgi:uncharacterized membrane protein YhaH (DUF805 family)